jgi:glutaredoxin
MADSDFVPLATTHGYTVYSKRECVWCERVKELLARETSSLVETIACDDALAANRLEFIRIMKERTGLETIKFPLVFHNGEFIGGYNDTKQHLELLA